MRTRLIAARIPRRKGRVKPKHANQFLQLLTTTKGFIPAPRRSHFTLLAHSVKSLAILPDKPLQIFVHRRGSRVSQRSGRVSNRYNAEVLPKSQQPAPPCIYWDGCWRRVLESHAAPSILFEFRWFNTRNLGTIQQRFQLKVFGVWFGGCTENGDGKWAWFSGPGEERQRSGCR